MTTMDVPTFGQFVTLRLAKYFAKKEKANEATNHASAWFQTVIRLVLHIAGFGCLTYAGFIWHPVAGFVAAGISCFLLSWVTTSGNSSAPKPSHQDPLMYGRDKR